MKPRVLLQLDPDHQPSVFDAMVAIDAGAEHLLRHGGIVPADVQGLVHGLLFTRGMDDLRHSAIFIGGSDVAKGEALLAAVRASFFGPFRVSALLDANGCNTTAAAAVLSVLDGFKHAKTNPKGATVTILAATGSVGQRVARLLLGLPDQLNVRVASRKLDRAEALAGALKGATGRQAMAFATDSAKALSAALEGADAVVAAGAAGVCLLPRAMWPYARVLVDLNAVPPTGIEGVEPNDRATPRGHAHAYGALGVGGLKMKIHKSALRALFESNDKILDAEECFELGRTLT